MQLGILFPRFGVMGLITLVSTPPGLRNSTQGFPKEIGMVDTLLKIWTKVRQLFPFQ